MRCRVFHHKQGTAVPQARKVLIIEDEEILAENLQTHFQRCGWDARIACNGKLAVIAADEFLPELILLDFHLPDMNGFQVLDAIRASHQCCGCVLMTGHPIDSMLADAQRRGIGHILCKPFPLSSLQGQMLAAAIDLSPNFPRS
jgi:DNA-binding response OmpR family regulator